MKKLTELNKKLFDSVQAGDLNLLKKLLFDGADINSRDCDGETILHDAAFSNDRLDIIKYLIEEKNFKINCLDNEFVTPLHEAARAGNLEFVKYLVEKGADINKQDIEGSTALDYAIDEDRDDVIKYLELKMVPEVK